jgi:hypothetical protein
MLAEVRLKIATVRNKLQSSKISFNVYTLRDGEINKQFRLELRNRFSVLSCEEEREYESSETVHDKWAVIKISYIKAAEEILGYREIGWKQWISNESWALAIQRRELKIKLNMTRTRAGKEVLNNQYNNKNREVKRRIKECGLRIFQRRHKELPNVIILIIYTK